MSTVEQWGQKSNKRTQKKDAKKGGDIVCTCGRYRMENAFEMSWYYYMSADVVFSLLAFTACTTYFSSGQKNGKQEGGLKKSQITSSSPSRPLPDTNYAKSRSRPFLLQEESGGRHKIIKTSKLRFSRRRVGRTYKKS